ncbi:response regulator [Vibrio sp. L5-1]|uniref:Chemotaxis protein CheY n=1 Tax=Vibrio splendidus TaxID=29497 RepID=A0A837NYX4_VIBSP|nr:MULTISPECIES: response regulator [Vibrio]KPL95735.1 chemotaxis protein CheY [Vibrio splendidus]MCF7493701.1 response regulator [Vibrio sp. L5-1]
MNNVIKKYTVLVADDSRLVTSSVTTILRQIGFESISYAYKPFDVIHQCRQNSFDIIICDYNFQTQLTGYQLLEELKHARILKSTTVFMFLTGENDYNVVRSIVDSDPDDYLLKPFNKQFFIKRIFSSLNRKLVLAPIFEKLTEFDFAGVVRECDELQPFHPEYSKLIRKYKASALLKSKQFNKAQEEYESLLEEDDLDWIKTGLASTLIETDQVDEAKEILSLVKSRKNNPYFHDEMSNIYSIEEDLPNAIDHLKQSAMLLDAGAHRELVIANLSIAAGAYQDSFTYMKRYYEKNINTFRGGFYTKINYVRTFLYKQTLGGSTNLFERQLISYNSILNDIGKTPELILQDKLISAHIGLIKGDLKTATLSIKQALNYTSEFHFYDFYHLCFLLEQCSFLSETPTFVARLEDSINKDQHPSIIRSQIHMLNGFKERLQTSQQQLSNIRKEMILMKSLDRLTKDKQLDYYLDIHNLLPHSKKTCLAIIKLSALLSTPYEGKHDIRIKINKCNDVLVNLYTKEELSSLNYNQILYKARGRATY